MAKGSTICVRRIVSGGQTGVDRAALDVAIELNIEHGGWCPRGRRAEDGYLDERYQLEETESPEYHIRTEKNVVDSDGTLILAYGELTGGTNLTKRFAIRHNKPYLVIDLNKRISVRATRKWLADEQIEVLNVAGPRESTSPGIYLTASNVLHSILGSRR
jgi:hypothetical protein